MTKGKARVHSAAAVVLAKARDVTENAGGVAGTMAAIVGGAAGVVAGVVEGATADHHPRAETVGDAPGEDAPGGDSF